MLFNYCRAPAHVVADDNVPMDFSMLGKGKRYNGKGDRKEIKDGGGKHVKGKGGGGMDEQKDKGKGKDNVRTAEYFPGRCGACKAWATGREAAGGTNLPNAGRTPHLWKRRADTASQPDALMTGMLLPMNYDCCKTGTDSSSWLFSVANGEAGENNILIDSGAATSVCRQSLSDRAELEWSSGEPMGIATPLQAVQILMHTRDETRCWANLQLAPKTTALEKPIIAVGRNIIMCHRSGGTIFNEGTGGRIDWERSCGVYRLKTDTSAKTASSTRARRLMMGFEHESADLAEAQLASPGTVPVLQGETDVEQHEHTYSFGIAAVTACSPKAKRANTMSLGGVSKFATDDMFMGEDGTPITTLAGCDDENILCQCVVPCKGAESAFAVNVSSAKETATPTDACEQAKPSKDRSRSVRRSALKVPS